MCINVCWYCGNYWVDGTVPYCLIDFKLYPIIRYRREKCDNFELDPRVNIDLDESEL